jgi:hypothetical protein
MLDLGVVDRGFYLQYPVHHKGTVDKTHDLPHPSQACKPVHHKGTVDKTHDLLCGALVYMLDLDVVDRGFYLRCLCSALVCMLDLGVVDRGFYLRCLCGALV